MINRACLCIVGLGLALLVSMLFRCVIAAQSPTAPAATMVAQHEAITHGH
jgi:hypothetical protein